MPTIKVMADYRCFPLWHCGGDIVGDLDPAELPISKALQDDLMAWAEAYEESFDWDDPMASRPWTEAETAAYRLAGDRLADRLRAELGPDWTVIRGPD